MATPSYFPVPDGFAWIADPDEALQRASVAFRTADGVVVVDPVDYAGLDERLATLGEVTRVLQLLDRHGRDSAAVAARHDVPLVSPGAGAWTPSGVDRISIVARKRWCEDALFVPSTGLAVIPEALGSVALFRAKGEPIGVHPILRLLPPRRALAGIRPDVIAFGHGAPLDHGATAALQEALATSRTRALRVYLGTIGKIRR